MRTSIEAEEATAVAVLSLTSGDGQGPTTLQLYPPEIPGARLGVWVAMTDAVMQCSGDVDWPRFAAWVNRMTQASLADETVAAARRRGREFARRHLLTKSPEDVLTLPRVRRGGRSFGDGVLDAVLLHSAATAASQPQSMHP